jgi:NADH dehydrogenase
MPAAHFDVVTGAFSYTGAAIAGRLLDAGRRVRTLTGHPDRDHPLRATVEAHPYSFDDPGALRGSLEGATHLYNTYWVRFLHGDVGFDQAIENSRRLFEAARDAGIRRIIHVSITKPSADSPLPYFRGKALVEEALAEIGVPHTIVRPTVVFGGGDILINNIAWLLRRLPVFGIPGSGTYRVRPVHVEDVARLCVEGARARTNKVVDAVGPETFTFEEMVRMIADAVGSRARLVHVPPVAVEAVARLIGLAVRDVVLTEQELEGLMAELVTTQGRATGETRLSDWVREHAGELGKTYASELARHYR